MRYLGVDFGLRKIGFATSEGELATPSKVIHVKNKEQAIVEIERVAKQEGVDKIIFGIPESGIKTTILKIGNKLKEKFGVEFMEETLSSKNAVSEMVKLGLKKKKRVEEDAYSAAIILQNYLDAK